MATSYILSNAVKKLAEHLGLSQVTCGLEAELEGEILKVTKELENGRAVIGVKLSCLVTFTKPVWDLCYPTHVKKIFVPKKKAGGVKIREETGRKKDIIIRGGENISSTEIEDIG